MIVYAKNGEMWGRGYEGKASVKRKKERERTRGCGSEREGMSDEAGDSSIARGVATWPSVSRYRTAASREALTTPVVGPPATSKRDSESREREGRAFFCLPMAPALRSYAPVEVGSANAILSLLRRFHRSGACRAR